MHSRPKLCPAYRPISRYTIEMCPFVSKLQMLSISVCNLLNLIEKITEILGLVRVSEHILRLEFYSNYDLA